MKLTNPYNLNKCIDNLISNKTVQNMIVRVGQGSNILCDIKKTVQDRSLSEHTLFDMASVTKIIVTTSLALVAIDRGTLSPSDKVSKFFPVPDDKKDMTVHHLLTHTMEIGHKSLLGSNGEHTGIEDYILNIPSDIPIGSNVLYSCPGFILLGRILERVYEERLDMAFNKHVALPLGMASTVFSPDRSADIVNANLSDSEIGVVNDYNCRYLGCICGNAGVFSNLADMTVYAKMLLSHGAPLLSEKIFALAAQNHTESMNDSRGLGYLYVDDRYYQTGGLFPDGSIGHCGHTGQSVFADPESGLFVIVLSDATISTVKKYGQQNYKEVKQMRHDIHAAIKADLIY